MQRSGFKAVFYLLIPKNQKEQDNKEEQSKFSVRVKQIQNRRAQFEKQAGPLQSAIDQRKSFRSLTLLINKAKANVDELKTTLDAVLKEIQNSSSTSSVMERYSNLLSRLEKFEHEIDSLDDDGLLSQYSTGIRDDVSVTTARYPTPQRCSRSMNEIPEASNPERSSFPNKTPPLPPRLERLSLFLSECHETKPILSKFLNGNNENPFSIGMSTSSSFRPININNTVESKTEVNYSDKNFAKPETTVAKLPIGSLSVLKHYLLLIILQSTSSSLN